MEKLDSLTDSFEEPREIPIDLTNQPVEPDASRVLSRVLSGRSQTFHGALPVMGGDKDYPPYLGDREPYCVEFEGPDDPLMALNWSLSRKLCVSGTLAYATLVVSWGSASYAPGMPQIMKRFHVGEPVAALGISLYVLGFALGPILWGPMSELYGRKLPLVIAYLLFVCFVFGSAVAKDFQTLIICRFFSGAVGSAPISIVAASFSDMFNTQTRGVAMSFYTLCVMGGPMISPIAGAYIADSYLGWRWTLYITGIMAAFALLMVVFLQEETYGPCILRQKALELRKRTGNWAIYAQIETLEMNVNEIVRRSVFRPVHMLCTEPVLLLISLYNGFVYGILYMCLEALPIIFGGYGWKGGNLMLPYIALFIGCACSTFLNILVFEPKFFRDLKKSGKTVHPDARLPFMMMGSVFFTIGIFWLCWTGAYHQYIHWIVPVIGGGFFGFGFIGLFIPVFNYVIDSYLLVAASALSGNAFLRGMMGTAFPLFSAIMFRNLGVQWAGTLVGCLSALMLPVPFLFYTFGDLIRSKSKFAVKVDNQVEDFLEHSG